MELKIVSNNGQLVTDSREVAALVDKRHTDLLRAITGYVEVLENAKLRSQDFFIPSTYKTEGNNKTYDCFLLTRKGCDMVANKMTGQKGILFTAAYVTKFEEMEKQIHRPKSQAELIAMMAQHNLEQEQRITAVEDKLEKATELLALHPVEWRKKVNSIINRVAQKHGGYNAYKEIRNESYKLLEDRAHCLLSTRLTNKKRKMALEGAGKSKLDKVSKMDVIADDARLTEIYLAIVKELAIKYDVDFEKSAV